jgi:FlaG protein
MSLNSILPNTSSRVPDALPARVAQPRAQTPSPSPPSSLHGVKLPAQTATEDVHVQWKGSEGVIVTFTDRRSGEVVRQLPPEQVLSVARFIGQMLDKEAASKSKTQS